MGYGPRRDRERHPRPQVGRRAQPSPLGPLSRQRRLAGRPPGNHQDPPATLLLPRRTAHPQGAPPHFASSPALALGKPVQSRPGTTASPATASLTAPSAPDPSPPAWQIRARSVSQRLPTRAALTISPNSAAAGRQHPLGAATAPRTQPNALGSRPHCLFLLPASLVSPT